MSVQFLHDQHGNSVFAVLPIEEYRRLVGEQQGVAGAPKPAPVIDGGSRLVRLPYAGPDFWLDAVELAKFLKEHKISDLAINQRAQALDKYPAEQSMTLDPIVRRVFLPEHSPYKNTMQCTGDVVDGLVATGLFIRTKRRYDFFRRAVNSLELVEEKLQQYLDNSEHS